VFGVAGTAQRGQIINFCPPPIPAFQDAKSRGYLHGGPCPGDFETLFKPVVAVAGDAVVFADDGMHVNGALVPNSKPVAVDGNGAAMPSLHQGAYAVREGEVWVVSSYTPWSFDSRYFGPIQTAAIRGQARPIWTREDRHE
jgi:conjugative transfer signal peptidase TraF